MTDIYLDSNATTPLLPAVWEAMRPYACDLAANPASSHRAGRRARQALEDAREAIAALLGAHADEVLFTSGATEANNLAIFGAADSSLPYLVASPLEHPSVIEPLQQLAQRGAPLHWLSADAQGQVAAILDPALAARAQLCCVMLANHETGSLQPITALAQQLAPHAFFHCDAAAAAGKIPIAFHALGVSGLTISAHKFHGPKGIGALLLRRGTALKPQLYGGHQQHGKRPGTEPVALVVGMAQALQLACREMTARGARVTQLRRRLLTLLRREAAPVYLNGPEEEGLPHTLNLSFPGCAADVLLMSLDLAGVACATGSACSSGSLLPSPVLQAMGVGAERLRSALRFSLSFLLDEATIQDAAQRIAAVVQRLRGS